jgi:hypothetical protein
MKKRVKAEAEIRWKAEKEKIDRELNDAIEEELLRNTTLHLGKTWKWFQVQPLTADRVWQAVPRKNITETTHTYECIDADRYWKIIFKKK